jgi:hypothetical protein
MTHPESQKNRKFPKKSRSRFFGKILLKSPNCVKVTLHLRGAMQRCRMSPLKRKNKLFVNGHGQWAAGAWKKQAEKSVWTA